MWKKTLAVVIVILMLMLPGCQFKFKASIENIENIIVAGIDEKDGNVILTIVTQVIQPEPAEDGGKAQKVAIYTIDGETIFDAARKFHSFTNKDTFWGHIDYVIVGEETAKKGICQFVDFFVRNHEQRIVATLLIAQDSTAEEIIKRTNIAQTPLYDRLKVLFEGAKASSQSKEIALTDYITMVNCRWRQLYLPCIYLVDRMEKQEEDKQFKDIELNGYALFEDDRMVGVVKGNSARAINFINNDVVTGLIVGHDPDGNKISLEIITSKCKIEPDFSGDMPTAKIKLQLSTSIAEYMGREDIFHDDIIDYIVKCQNTIVMKELAETMAYLKEIKTDVIGIGNAVYHKYPIKSETVQQNWGDVFSQMAISIEVQSKINRSYTINESVGSRES